MHLRRFLPYFLILLASMLAACKLADRDTQKEDGMESKKTKIVYLDVNLYSYHERPILDVMLNGKFIGDTAGQPHRGNGGLMTGVQVPLGEQIITWRLDGPEGMPGNGDTVQAVNKPILQVPGKDETYLGVHIYPDNTVELIPEKFWPNKTEKGEAINHQWELDHGM